MIKKWYTRFRLYLNTKQSVYNAFLYSGKTSRVDIPYSAISNSYWSLEARRLVADKVPGCGYGRCGCCRLPWYIVRGHMTDYSEGSGCFPLCEECWRMFNPDDRLPFYRQLFDEWNKDGEYSNWDEIKEAVLSGK